MALRCRRSGAWLPSRRIDAVLMVSTLFLQAGQALAAACGAWDLAPTPNVGNSVTRLTAVTALAADDAWSVGYWRNQPAGRGPLALRWDGSAWSETDLPATGHLGTFPEAAGVDAAPNGDVWVVGNVTTTYPTYNLPLVLRWRDGSWDYVETVTLRPQNTYPFGPRGGFAYEVDAITPDDVWAVGLAAGFGDAAATSLPMAIHWDGSTWTDVDVPRVANRHHELSDLVAISTDDVWAVGNYRNEPGPFHAITYHWDGNTWTHIHSPIEDVADSDLEDIVATGPNDVWAIGAGPNGVLVQHWDGSQWNLVQPPPNTGGSLAAVGPNDLWASGWTGFWHWNGAAWTEVPASVPGASYMIRSGGMEIIGGCDIWCVGFWTLADGITSFTLAERLQNPTVAVDPPPAADAFLTFRNPYWPGDPIHIAIPSEETARLTVHDLRGRIVRSLLLEPAGGVPRTKTWDGRTDAGWRAPAGIYFLRLDAGDRREGRKLLLVGTGG